MLRIFALLAALCAATSTSFSQSDPVHLLARADRNHLLLKTDPETAMTTAVKLGKEAAEANAPEAELKSIQTECGYHRLANDFGKMMDAAKRLDDKAAAYKFPLYRLIAKRHLFESYLFTGLPDEALRELRAGEQVMKRLRGTDSLHVIERSNFYVAFSNYHLLQNDYENQLKYIRLSGDELKKLPDGYHNRRLLNVHYSNLASSFNNNDRRDSAKFYALLSQEMNREFNRSEVVFNNLKVLGDVEMHEGDYDAALQYLLKAEKTDGYKNYLDIEGVYDHIILAYSSTGREDSAQAYRAKKDSLKLTISENRNRSLHRLLVEKSRNPTNRFVYPALLAFLLLGAFIFYLVRKNRLLAAQDRLSQQYLESESNPPSGEDFSRLLTLVEENDPAFMYHFEETFPDFADKLRNINPKITQNDLEFCALLKLRIPTKDIAKYRFIAPKTVRNRKYNIRKKLGIPGEVDIYQWFSDL